MLRFRQAPGRQAAPNIPRSVEPVISAPPISTNAPLACGQSLDVYELAYETYGG
jgi:hypothetical protein